MTSSIYTKFWTYSNNQVTISGSGITNGFNFETEGTNTFEGAITGNTFLINGSTSNDYGINLAVSGSGEINFNSNSSPSELSSSNHDASVNPSVATPGINYNG